MNSQRINNGLRLTVNTSTTFKMRQPITNNNVYKFFYFIPKAELVCVAPFFFNFAKTLILSTLTSVA